MSRWRQEQGSVAATTDTLNCWIGVTQESYPKVNGAVLGAFQLYLKWFTYLCILSDIIHSLK